jgi:hypothetical protein
MEAASRARPLLLFIVWLSTYAIVSWRVLNGSLIFVFYLFLVIKYHT